MAEPGNPPQVDPAQVAAQREGVALVAPGTVVAPEWLELTGPDRVRFLHNLTTCDVQSLAPGTSARGFFTDVKGHVLADFDLIVHDDFLRLRVPAGRAAFLLEHLAKYRIVERVGMAARGDLAAAELRGRAAAGLLAQLGIESPAEPGVHAAAEWAGAAVELRALPRGGAPRLELTAPGPAMERALSEIRRAGAPIGLVEPSAAAVETVRIEDGELAWGIDYGDDSFPQETGESAAVSTTKGCYLGQEVVARLHYRGQVQRVARGLVFATGAAPAAGLELAAPDGRPAARATSVARSPALGATVALARVQRRAAEPGTRLTWEGGDAEVRRLPLVTDPGPPGR
jgi:folate-binding protein YgfZ